MLDDIPKLEIINIFDEYCRIMEKRLVKSCKNKLISKIGQNTYFRQFKD